MIRILLNSLNLWINVLIVFLLLTAAEMRAQLEAKHWYFGVNQELHFNGGLAQPDSQSVMQTFESAASISDEKGNLQFYSDGITVYNRNHQVMANGTQLNGDKSTTQGALAFRKPGTSDKYYLFHQGAWGTGILSYTEIDMTLAAGLGSVTAKNNTLIAGMTEKLSATMHCNGRDVWVVAHKYLSDEFYAYLVTPTGVSLTPVVSQKGSVHAPVSSTVNSTYVGQMKISPGGRKIAVVTSNDVNLVELFDFNNQTGQITNAQILDTVFYATGCEFSQNQRMLYVSSGAALGALYQYELTAGSPQAVTASRILLHAANPPNPKFFFGLQLGIDGRIYVSNTKDTLPVIHNPNQAGLSCNYDSAAILMPVKLSGAAAFPNFVSNLFRKRADATVTTSACGVATFSLQRPAYYPGLSDSIHSVVWDFGDPASGSANTSTVDFPQHTYASNGSYIVKLVTAYPCFIDTLTDTIQINHYPTLSIQNPSALCKGDLATFTVSGANTYTWSGGVNGDHFPFSLTTDTTISVIGTNQQGCISSASLAVKVSPCIGLKENTIENIRIYPNPSSGIYRVTGAKGRKLALYNGSGTLLKIFLVTDSDFRLVMEDLPAGIYYARLGHEGGWTLIRTD